MSVIPIIGSQKHNAVTFTGQQNLAYINTQTPYDSTSFTSKQNKKKSFLQKHFGEILIGVGVLAAGVFLTKGKLWGKPNFAKVQKNFAEIFGKKNLTKEETEKLIQKYREIYNIKDKDEFIRQAFNQIKKDFGYENTSITLNICHKRIKSKSSLGASGSYNIQNIKIYAKRTRARILDTIAHEFKHMKQFESMYRADSKKCTQIVIDMYNLTTSAELKEIYAENPKKFNEVVEEFFLKKDFGHLPKFKEGSPEYAQSENYFEAKMNYSKDKAGKNKDYRSNLLEQESIRVGSLMHEIANYIKFSSTPT